MKYLLIDQMTYLKQMYTRLLNFTDNNYCQYYRVLILVQ